MSSVTSTVARPPIGPPVSPIDYREIYRGHDFLNTLWYDFTRSNLRSVRKKGRTLTWTDRGSNATYFDSAGVLQTADTNTPRLAAHRYNGSAWVNEGYIPSGQITNSALNSRDYTMDDVIWFDANTPVLTQNQTGADGVANQAWTAEDDSNSSFEYFFQSVTIPNDSNTHIAWFRIGKDNDNTRFPEFQLRLINGTTQYNLVQINTKTGASVKRSWSGTVNNGVIDQGDWWLIWISVANNSSGNTQAQLRLFPAITTTLGGSSAAAVGSIVLDRCQLQLNSNIPVLDIPTTGAAVTKNADDLSFDVSGHWPIRTWVIDGRTALRSGTQYFLALHDGTADEQLYFYRDASNDLHCVIVAGGVEQVDHTIGTIANDTYFKAAVSFDGDGIASSLDGAAVETGSGVTIPTCTTGEIGQDRSNANHWFGFVRGNKGYAPTKSHSELMELAA